MKHINKYAGIYLLFLFSIFLSTLASENLGAQEAPETTTFYIVRHADRDGDKDALTAEGKQRAQHLSQLMQHFRISDIYSTETTRTQETAKPTADLLQLEVKPYGKLEASWFEKIKSDHVGESVLIVGHSNTSGQIAEGLGGQGDFAIDEDEYDSLFIVTLDENGSKSVRIQFGASTASEKSPEH